jgi:hypothetical protein
MSESACGPTNLQEVLHAIHVTGLSSLANRTAKVFAYESSYWNLVRRCIP